MTFLRWVGSVCALVPMVIGLVAGLVVHSFVLGYRAGVEVIDEHMDWIGRKRDEKGKA
jgi:hypothetical protein